MTDKGPPGGRPRDRQKRAVPDADLDAELWPSPSEPPPARQPARVQPRLRVVPLPDSPGQSGRSAVPRTDAGSPAAAAHPAPAAEPGAPEPFYEPAEPSGNYLTGPAPPGSSGRSRGLATSPPRMPARERLRQERQRQSRRRRRRVRLVAVFAVLAVLAAGGAITFVLHHHAAPAPRMVRFGSAYSGPYAPVTINADDSVTMAQPGVTRPVLNVYEDFQCPPCQAFEKANGGLIQQLAALGKIKVVYHPFTIFSRQPEMANSTRAWAAAKCAPAADWVAYHNALFAAQPTLTAAGGFPVVQLEQLGQNAGITSQGFAGCVGSQRYAGQDAQVSNRVLSNGPDGLPTLRLNGRLLTVSPVSKGLRQKLISASSS
jgi:protein-disulfide isomerase